MLTIVYDRNFKERRDKQKDWHIGERVPELDPHRVIEVWADGDEKRHLETMMGSLGEGFQAIYYGDLARTVYLNLLHNS